MFSPQQILRIVYEQTIANVDAADRHGILLRQENRDTLALVLWPFRAALAYKETEKYSPLLLFMIKQIDKPPEPGPDGTFSIDPRSTETACMWYVDYEKVVPEVWEKSKGYLMRERLMFFPHKQAIARFPIARITLGLIEVMQKAIVGLYQQVVLQTHWQAELKPGDYSKP